MVKEGYKQTDIGVIPEDWEIKNIGDVCQIFGRIGFRGYTVQDIVDEDKGVITLSPSNIINNNTVFDKCTYISWFKYEESPEIKIFNGDILLVKTGSTVGKTAIVKGLQKPATINPQIVVLKKITIDNLYLGYLAGYKDFQNNITRTTVGGAIPTLSQKQIANYKIPIPSQFEQKAIAQALGDTDELITSLDKLIAKKEAIKQGTMQQLLMGKKRLAGFSEEWEEKKLGDIVHVIGGGTPRTTMGDFWNGSINWFTPTEIGKKKYVFESIRKITEEGLNSSSARLLPIGTILLTSRAGIGDCAILQEPSTTNQGFQSLVPMPNTDSEFLYYLTLTLKEKFLQKASGSTFLEISPNNVRDIDILMPKKDEQQAIAKVLFDMDNEIEMLKTKLSKTKAIKDAMMSELLTGKTRLKVSDS